MEIEFCQSDTRDFVTGLPAPPILFRWSNSCAQVPSTMICDVAIFGRHPWAIRQSGQAKRGRLPKRTWAGRPDLLLHLKQ